MLDVSANFSAKVNVENRLPVDVEITLDGEHVTMTAGRDRIGGWRRSDCEFEQRGPRSYDFRAEGETLSIDVTDPSRFRRALDLVLEERAPILPR